MVIVLLLLVCALAFLAVNLKVRRTNAYREFYRTIHVVKDVPKQQKYRVAAFGSTFAYYAYELKTYGGHNFSIEPQSVRYMKKTVDHFLTNIEKSGIALLSLAGCFFAASSTATDEACVTYYSFLPQEQFDKYSRKTAVKYLLKRYLPALSPGYFKRIVNDVPPMFSADRGISYETGLRQAAGRVKGWERVVGKEITESFTVDENLQAKIDENIRSMRSIIAAVRQAGVTPVFVILPMSKAFHAVCPRQFYDAILYRALETLSNENVCVADFLYDEELGEMEYYLTADCLNAKGRAVFTKKLMDRIGDVTDSAPKQETKDGAENEDYC